MDGRMGHGYHYSESGLDYVWLEDGYHIVETSRGKGITIEDIDGLHGAIGRYIIDRKGQMTGDEVRFLRHELDWSQIVLGEYLGVTDQTVARWEKGLVNIPAPEQKLLAGIYRESLTGSADLRASIERIAKLDAEVQKSLTLHRAGDDWRLCA
jgi:DNA-binding transcriptional regulator YiaG